HLLDGGADAFFLVVARDDDGDAFASEHEKAPHEPWSGVRRGLGRGAGAGAAGGDRGARRGPPGELAPRLADLEARPLLQHGRHHARVEEDVDGEEALVRAEALRLADEAARRLGGLAEPDLLEVVARLPHVPELAVDQQLARIDV